MPLLVIAQSLRVILLAITLTPSLLFSFEDYTRDVSRLGSGDCLSPTMPLFVASQVLRVTILGITLPVIC